MALAIESFYFYSAIATDDSEIALFTKLSNLDSAVSRLYDTMLDSLVPRILSTANDSFYPEVSWLVCAAIQVWLSSSGAFSVCFMCREREW